jgi:CDGSH-type Zn-finger protein
MAVIRVRLNGSLLVEGDDVTLVDWNGNEYTPPKRPYSLCRCGASAKKPFCDGAHKTAGFVGDQPAVPAGGDPPAGH